MCGKKLGMQDRHERRVEVWRVLRWKKPPPIGSGSGHGTPVIRSVCRGVYASLDGDGDEKVTEAEVCDAAEERGLVLTDEQAFLASDGEADAGDGGVSLDEQLTGIDGRVQGTYEGRRTTLWAVSTLLSLR